MGPGILPETTVGKHSPLCHLQMPTKDLSFKKKAMLQKCHHVLWAKAHLKCFKVEKCSRVRRVQIFHIKRTFGAFGTFFLNLFLITNHELFIKKYYYVLGETHIKPELSLPCQENIKLSIDVDSLKDPQLFSL